LPITKNKTSHPLPLFSSEKRFSDPEEAGIFQIYISPLHPSPKLFLVGLAIFNGKIFIKTGRIVFKML